MKSVRSFLLPCSIGIAISFSPVSAQLVSDDFSHTAIDTAVWRWIDPAGDAAFALTGTHLAIAVPGGTDHDITRHRNRAARLMQSLPDRDFRLEVRFDSRLQRKKQAQGILIEHDAETYLQFGIFHDGGRVRIAAALVAGAQQKTLANQKLATSAPLWVRVTRRADTWIFARSYDQNTWVTVDTIRQTLHVTAAGVYAGNAGGAFAPAFTALVDYFFDAASPVQPEDGTAGDRVPPVISNIEIAPGAGSANLTFSTDEFCTAEIEYGLSAPLPAQERLPGLAKKHEVSLRGLAHGATYRLRIAASDASGNTSVTAEMQFTTQVDTTGPQIEIWHGTRQRVGHLGAAQRDFNVLGHVSDASRVRTLTYSLNGSAPAGLTIGSDPNGFGDGRRLAANGDFNADIPLAALAPGSNRIALVATDEHGNRTRREMTVHRENGACPLPLQIHWSQVNHPQDAVQITDGLWVIEDGGLRPRRPGYDRIFLAGDTTWQDYEVLLRVKVHGMDALTGPFSGPPGLGVILRFAGHVSGGYRNWPRTQPKYGFLPFGGMAFLRWTAGPGQPAMKQFLRGDDAIITNHGAADMQLETWYAIRMRCETLSTAPGAPGRSRYSYKIWPADTAEPAAWDWQHVQESEHALQRGSLALVAHHVDASFGALSVMALPVGMNGNSLAIENVQVQVLGRHAAAISWETDRPAHGQVVLRKSDPAEIPWQVDDPAFKLVHRIVLSNLDPGTRYAAQIVAEDAHGNTATRPGLAFTTGSPPRPGDPGLVSDEFSAAELDTSLWREIEARFGSRVALAGGHLVFTLTAGDSLQSPTPAIRLAQPAQNRDFAVEVGFEVTPAPYAVRFGLAVNGADQQRLLFEVQRAGAAATVRAVFFDRGTFETLGDTVFAAGAVLPLHLSRVGDEWVLARRDARGRLERLMQFTRLLEVAAVGLFASSRSGETAVPLAVRVDYFRAQALTTGVPVPDRSPRRFRLSDAFPNPFNPETQLTLELLQKQRVEVEVFDLLGRRVAILFDGNVPAGVEKKLLFFAGNLPSGVYILRATGKTFVAHRKMTLQR